MHYYINNVHVSAFAVAWASMMEAASKLRLLERPAAATDDF